MRRLSTILLLFAGTACVDPFSIKSITNAGTLVVEGILSTELKQHAIYLSRTSPVNKQQRLPETGAQVFIDFDSGTIPLTESSAGTYLTPPVQGVVGKTYSLRITTADGDQVESTDVTLRYTPPIANVYGQYNPTIPSLNNGAGFQILLDAKDTTNQTNYYRWEYEETWELQTPFESEFIWLGGNNVAFRTVPVSTCYASDTSSNVIIQTTNGLASNEINSQVVRVFSADGLQMRVQYSILVRQYSLSEQGYLYWLNIKKINETQGGLYDTQPGEVLGNLKMKNGTGTVLGYFDACTIQQKRIFMTPPAYRSQGFTPTDYLSYCSSITAVQVAQDQIGNFLSQPSNSGLEIIGATGFGPSTLYLLPKQCCDCTSQGTNIKPSFWP